MSETNFLEAFGRYKTKPSPRGRSAMTQEGTLVVSCWYALFRKAESGVLRYEEDLSVDTGSAANALRAHLAKALEDESEIRLIVAVSPPSASQQAAQDAPSTERPKQTTFHARQDLVGRLTFYDGKKFIIEFRKRAAAA